MQLLSGLYEFCCFFGSRLSASILQSIHRDGQHKRASVGLWLPSPE